MRFAVLILIYSILLPCHLAAEDAMVVENAKKEIALKGYTRGKTAVTVSSEVAGKVLRVNYDVGKTVGSAPFIEIDPIFINFAIETTRQGIKNLQIALQKSNSRIAYLKKEFARIDHLFKGKSTAETQRDKAAVKRFRC